MPVIIAICLLLLFAYVFDISASRTKIPSVILLLILGIMVKEAVGFFQIQIPNLHPLLPIIGTIGLILIVLEGALELKLDKSKLPLIKKSLLVALVPMFILTFFLAWLFQYFGDVSYKIGLINAIPFCVISSAIAIPSVQHLETRHKEFVVYESSLSDIFGVLLFNFFALNESVNMVSFRNFGLELVLIVFISFIAVLALSFLLSRIKHHVTYTPIILLIILIYAVSKVYHLPGLIFILVFGLFLSNLDEMKGLKWIHLFRLEKLNKEVLKFKGITVEATFLVRVTFFILFGFLMQREEIFQMATIPWALLIVVSMLIIRWMMLKIFKLPVFPLLFVAPRGLITVLLFLSILPEQSFDIVNKSLIIQTIIISVLLMMFGFMGGAKIKEHKVSLN